MVQVVRGAARHQFEGAVADMHRDRKRVFVDRLGWRIPISEGELEVDQFDTNEAVYLMDLDDGGLHLGSARLLPSTGPHILGDVFPHLCVRGVPRGEDIWEITRLCTKPDTPRPELVRQRLTLAIIEFALISGIRRLTCVTHVPYLSRILSVGWDCEPLGLPEDHAGAAIGAVAINVTPETLALMRDRMGVFKSVLHMDMPRAA